jgi:RecB family exonuclease
VEASPVARIASSADRVLREAPFRLVLDGAELVGSIDLLAWSGQSATVVDYKTGAAAEAESAARHADHELQAACYALAALRAGAHAVEVRFVFVEHPGSELAYRYGPADENALLARVMRPIASVQSGAATTTDPSVCETCPAAALCDDRPTASGILTPDEGE